MAADTPIASETGKKVDGRVLYGHMIEDIRFLKRNQWMISNYGASVQVALVALYRFALDQPKALSSPERYVLTLTSILAALGAIYLLMRFQRSMAEYRVRLNRLCRVCTECPEDPKDVDSMGDPHRYESFWKDGSIFGLMCAVQCFGALAVAWLVWR